MSWLAVTKILPGLKRGERPDFYSSLTAAAPRRPPDCWRISWHDKTIGFAATDIDHLPDGRAAMRSVAQFDQLPLQSIVNELFGVLAVALKPFFEGGSNMELELLVATRLEFDADQRFSGFTTHIDAADQPDFLVLGGDVDATNVLSLEARIFDGASGGRGTRVMQRKIELPAGALVGDALAPRPELNGLFVGQSWTVPVYRPFPPGSPPRIMQATVKRLEPIFWEGNEIETMLVVYQSAAGSDINIASDPTGREWVRADGTVMRQEVMFSGLKFQFERLPADHLDSRVELLDVVKHPRLWQRADADATTSPQPHAAAGRGNRP